MTLDAGVKKLAEFIHKLKSKAIQETMGVDKGKVRDVKRVRNTVFREHKTLEEALAAGLRCTKCVATKLSTKGCKAYMGKWFEAIMQPVLIQVLIDNNLQYMHIYNGYNRNYINYVIKQQHAFTIVIYVYIYKYMYNYMYVCVYVCICIFVHLYLYNYI